MQTDSYDSILSCKLILSSPAKGCSAIVSGNIITVNIYVWVNRHSDGYICM